MAQVQAPVAAELLLDGEAAAEQGAAIHQQPEALHHSDMAAVAVVVAPTTLAEQVVLVL